MSYKRSTSARFAPNVRAQHRATILCFRDALTAKGLEHGNAKFEFHYDAVGNVTIVSRHRREPEQMDAIVREFELLMRGRGLAP